MKKGQSEVIYEKLNEELKAAMRSKDQARLRTIRSLKAAIKEKEIELRRGGTALLTEKDVLAVIQKQAKQRRDAITQYQSAQRQDLVDKEQEELDILETYLPKQLPDEELRIVIDRIIFATGALSPGDMGKVMGPVMKELKGKADGRRVQQIALEILKNKSQA